MAIIVDNDTHAKIIKLSAHLNRGSIPVDFSIKNDVRSLMGVVLKKLRLRYSKSYGDVFTGHELIRFKFLVEGLHEDDLPIILSKLETKFIIKEITYIDNMLIFWM